MATLVSASLDVTKIKKQKLKDGKYLNITVSINDDTNKFGQNVGVYEPQSKEEREGKEKKRSPRTSTKVGRRKSFRCTSRQ